MDKRRADLTFVLIALIWGGTFPVIKTVVDVVPPHALVGARFGLAVILVGLVYYKRLLRITPRALGAGMLLGLFLWGGFFTQTVGLQYTTASKAGFITALSVVFVPVLSAIFLRKRPSWAAWVGVALATVGLAFLSLDLDAAYVLETGDLWVLACAGFFAGQIVLVDVLSRREDPLILAWVQMAFVAVAACLAATVTGGWPSAVTSGAWAGILYLAVFATALALLAQMAVQKYTTPTRVGLILALEPVFAALFAFLFLAERLLPRGLFGAALVLVGVILAELERPGPTRPVTPAQPRGEIGRGDVGV